MNAPAAAISLSVNGRRLEIPDGETVDGLLRRLDITGSPVAVEVNRDVVPRALHATTRLKDGDRVEVVQFVGGGT
jgi:sulfur carrier protein